MLDSGELHAKPCIYSPPSCIHLHICSSQVVQETKSHAAPQPSPLPPLVLRHGTTSNVLWRSLSNVHVLGRIPGHEASKAEPLLRRKSPHLRGLPPGLPQRGGVGPREEVPPTKGTACLCRDQPEPNLRRWKSTHIRQARRQGLDHTIWYLSNSSLIGIQLELLLIRYIQWKSQSCFALFFLVQ